MTIKGRAALAPNEALQPYSYEPTPLEAHDVNIAITHCGICHSDIHLIDNDWQISSYPFIPGHEIIGTVRAMGSSVAHLRIGQRVGVGWQRSSCMHCEWCYRGDENCCARQEATCVGHHGGYAEGIRVDSRFAFPIPEALPSEGAAPLLCGGITVYSPLSLDARQASRVGIIGVGGLGHMAIQFANAMGCEVTAFSTTPAKEEEARGLGSHHFVVSTDGSQMEKAAASQDLIVSTVTAELDWGAWIQLLRPKGTLAIVGASPGTISIPPLGLIVGQKTIRGSAIGSRSKIHEMLEVAARHGVTAQTEVFPLADVNLALEKVRKNQVRFRAVLKV